MTDEALLENFKRITDGTFGLALKMGRSPHFVKKALIDCLEPEQGDTPDDRRIMEEVREAAKAGRFDIYIAAAMRYV